MSDLPVTSLVGVYDAEGGLPRRGGVRVGQAPRHPPTARCCDITHGPGAPQARMGPDGRRAACRVDLLHLDELPPDVAETVAGCGVPVILARTAAGLAPLVSADELEAMDGSVERLSDLLDPPAVPT